MHNSDIYLLFYICTQFLFVRYHFLRFWRFLSPYPCSMIRTLFNLQIFWACMPHASTELVWATDGTIQLACKSVHATCSFMWYAGCPSPRSRRRLMTRTLQVALNHTCEQITSQCWILSTQLLFRGPRGVVGELAFGKSFRPFFTFFCAGECHNCTNNEF